MHGGALADLFAQPTGAAVDDTKAFTRPWANWINWVHEFVYAGRQSGVTVDRPTSGLWIGRCYFDTTLNRPVYVSAVRPTVWRGADGVIA